MIPIEYARVLKEVIHSDENPLGGVAGAATAVAQRQQ
jgi:hypothetical protein